MKIELRHIHKRFGPVHANNDINHTFGEGKIIGILGENGAGKSTLMKILSGFQPADSGKIWINDQAVDYTGPLAAIAHGIGMLQQDPLDVGAFTVLENFTYGAVGSLMLNRAQIRNHLQQTCQRLGFDLSPHMLINQLTIAQRQQLEIVRLLALGVTTLILDEPTTGISAEQKDLLFETLRSLAHHDGMTILLVSHKLEDVIVLCDEVMVLRAGVKVGERQMPATKTELVTMMFGQAMILEPRERSKLEGVPPVLELRNVHLSDSRLDMPNTNLHIQRGEVIGLAGLDGSGQELLMRAAAGLKKTQGGDVLVNGLKMTGQPYRLFMKAGIIFGAAGRLEEGLIAGLTLTEHMALIHETGTMIDWQRIRQYTDSQIQHYNVRGQAQHTMEMLSGGNQQRVLMAILPENAHALILEQPTRGLDVDSAHWIWEQLLARREDGTAIVFSSPDLDEIMLYSDRIIVCFAGQLYIVNDPDAVNVNDLGHYIGGEFPQ